MTTENNILAPPTAKPTIEDAVPTYWERFAMARALVIAGYYMQSWPRDVWSVMDWNKGTKSGEVEYMNMVLYKYFPELALSMRQELKERIVPHLQREVMMTDPVLPEAKE